MHFLELPRELRDLIYIFVLCPGGAGGGIKVKQPSKYRGKSDEDQTLALFAVCRQIHAEALPIYYTKNMFYVDPPYYLGFLVQQHNAQQIRAISLAPIGETTSYRVSLINGLRDLSQLEHLELQITNGSILQCLTYLTQENKSLAQQLEDEPDFKWLMSMSGLSHLRIKWMYQCGGTRHVEPGPCPTCAGCPALREEVEACLRAEVTQPREPYGQSPTHLARAQRSRAERQFRFRAEIRKLDELMQMELQHPERDVLHEELRMYFAT